MRTSTPHSDLIFSLILFFYCGFQNSTRAHSVTACASLARITNFWWIRMKHSMWHKRLRRWRQNEWKRFQKTVNYHQRDRIAFVDAWRWWHETTRRRRRRRQHDTPKPATQMESKFFSSYVHRLFAHTWAHWPESTTEWGKKVPAIRICTKCRSLLLILCYRYVLFDFSICMSLCMQH